jgi:membrane associated rhomboid family serine protease
MLPIKDDIRSRSFPLVTWLLIAANALVFFFMLGLSPTAQEAFVMRFGLVPASLDISRPASLLPFLTHMFLHAGWLHFLGNVWTLYIFGDNVEDRMGSLVFLLFYLVGGLAAAVAQTFFLQNSPMPLVGASGAIAAVMGAYFAYYPRARVMTLVPLFFLGWFVNLPAVIYLGFWFLTQVFSGVTQLASGTMAVGGVAWWAHIGGFVFGALLAYPLARRRSPWYPDEYHPW